MAEGITHISCHHTRIRSRETGENRKTNEQTRTKLGVTKSRGRYCNIICMCGLSLAWVTSENSTMLLESDILRFFFTGPYLVSSPLCSVSGVDCPSILPRQLLFCCLPLCSPATNSSAPVQLPTASLGLLPPTASLGLLPPTLLSPVQLLTASLWSLPLSGPRHQLSFASPYHFRVRRDFMSKNPLSGFAPKQTIESSALAAYPHSATQGHSHQIFLFMLFAYHNKIWSLFH